MASEGPPLCPRGYMVVGLSLKPNVLDAAVREAHDKRYIPIFETVGGPMDPYRLQSPVKTRSAALKEIDKALKEVIDMIYPRWKPTRFAFMRSVAGGPDQGPHRDFTDEDMEKAARLRGAGGIPGSAIVALQEGTKLCVFKGCLKEVDEAKEEIVDVPAGFALIFRGDLIHSGTDYADLNHRLHGYLSIKNWTRDANTTQGVHGREHECGHGDCQFKSENANKLRQHRYTCKVNPNAEQNKANRRARDQRETSCDVCGGSYTVGGLRSHKKAVH